MCVYKRATTRSKLHFAAFVAAAISTIIIGGNASAATTTGGIITEGNARWEYSLKTDGDNQELSIMFYDKDPDATTITVPSLADLTDGSVPGITATLDTYFLKNADTAAQNTAYGSTYPRRTATANTTKLDMSNTSKIQILGVKPIIDPNTETELVFGENMVIGDQEALIATFDVCLEGRTWVNKNKRYYGCNRTGTRDFDVYGDAYANWSTMTSAQKLAYIGCNDAGNINSSNYQSISPTNCFAYTSNQKTRTALLGYAFSGYKLKLTNFVESNFNYIGGMSFKNSVFNAENTTMTIEGDAFWGIDIFANTNITKAIIKTDTIGAGIFRDCANLSEVEFDSSVTKVSDDAFAGSGLTSISFEGTNIKTIGPRAFEESAVADINLNGVNHVQYAAFRNANQITELLLPKSLTKLEMNAFGISSLKKLTVAYDTMQPGMALPLNLVVGTGSYWNAGSIPIEELNVIAPYGAGEAVSQTHLNYDQYRWHTNCWTGEYLETDIREANYQVWNPYGWNSQTQQYDGSMGTCYGASTGYAWVDRSEYGGKGANITSGNLGYKFEDDFANVNSYKNIIAPLYFYGFTSLKKLSIGEGIEYVGSSAFDYNWGSSISGPILDEVSLPANSLKGIGNLAFAHNRFDTDLPQSLTFIGAGAFQYNNYLDFNFDFPNLVAVGDYAFAETKARDVIFTSSLKYIGNQIFEKYYDSYSSSSKTLHDVTIDLDIFGPEVNVPSLRYNPAKNEWSGQFGFTAMIAGGCYAPEYGTITFTDKVQTEIPSSFVHDYVDNKSGYGAYSWFFGMHGCGGNFRADKIDLSKTGWKVLPKMMTYGSFVGEFILPEHLEVMSERAFNNSSIEEPLVLPSTLKVIGDAAFECGYSCRYGEQSGYKPLSIESLPTSLEYIGVEAFYGQAGVSGDLLAPNLSYIGTRAFEGTSIRDVLIPEGVTALREATFAHIPTLRDITIDNDFGAAVATNLDRTSSAYTLPQSLSTFYGDDTNAAFEKFIFDRIIDDRTRIYDPETRTYLPYSVQGNQSFTSFYTIFNKTMTNQQDAKEEFGTVIFTEHATTNIPGNPGTFAWFKFDTLDFSQTGWTSLIAGSTDFSTLVGAEIGTLKLPGGLKSIGKWDLLEAKIDNPIEIPTTLESIGEGAFIRANIGGDVVLPSTFTDLGAMAFMEAAIDGDFTIKNASTNINLLETWGRSNAFIRANISGTMTLNRMTTIPSGLFLESKLGGLVLNEGLETINSDAFLRAEISGDVIIPSSVTTLGIGVFNESKIEGGVTIKDGASELTFNGGTGTPSANTFIKSVIGGTVTVPSRVKTITGQTFLESQLGGLSLANGIETIGHDAFTKAKIGGSFSLPSTLKTIEHAAFIESDINITNALPEGLETIADAAFYATDFTDNLVIPSTVTSLGWAAFNAGSVDVHYDTVTIKPDLTEQNSDGQMVHQKFWGASIDKLIVDSSMLVALDRGIEGPETEENASGYIEGNEEFWNMDIKEVVLNNIPKITYAAFNKCTKLEKVDLSNNTAIREIDDKAFENDEKLSTILFSPSIKNENIVLGINAFTNTGFTTIGKDGTDFNLAAAHFDATAGKVFNKMKNLKSVDVPETFSYAKVPEKTFSDAPELEEATIDYHITLIDNAAFSNDNKLKRIFIWGNTVVLDENLPGYTPPTNGMGADGDEEETETFGPTIPEGTDIYAYSTAPTEAYAAYTGRESFDGTFYPLDEVLYLTTNKTYVKIDDNKDFDKNGLTVYGLRRDGMVVESDSWAEYDDNSYSRHDAELTFAKMEPTIEENPDFGTVWDTPVPKAELNFANVNFETIDYELVEDPEGPEGVKLINIIYTDKYTEGKPDTDVLPYVEPPVPIPVPIPVPTPDNPVTSAINIFAYIASFGAASGVLAVVIRNKLARSRR